MTVLGIPTQSEVQADLATLRGQVKSDMAAVLVPDVASAVLPLGVQLNDIQAAIGALVLPAGSLDSIANQIVTAVLSGIVPTLQQIIQEIQTMSATLESQVQAATAAIQADVAALATDLTAVAAQIADLQARQAVGTTITQADVDALNGVKASMDAARATADAMANPAPVTPPVATP